MKGKNILLVEENEHINAINRRALLREGYDVLVARNLGEARVLLTQHGIEVVLMEITLPDGCGIAFCEEIRGRGKDTHILFLASCNSPQDGLRALAAGGDDYITKPYDIEIGRASCRERV